MKPRIFVSAVTEEFRTARLKVKHLLEFLDFEVEQQEIFGTEPGDLREVLKGKISSCIGLVQIVGHGYGAEPPHSDPVLGRCSYTQLEFYYAREMGKTTWLVFAGNEAGRDKPIEHLDLPPEHVPADPVAYQAERRHLQEKYKAGFRGDDAHLRHHFRNDTELENVILKLNRTATEVETIRKKYHTWQQDVSTGMRTHNRSLALLMTCVFALVMVVVGGFAWLSWQAEENKKQEEIARREDDERRKKELQELRDSLFENLRKESLMSKDQQTAAAEELADPVKRQQALAKAEADFKQRQEQSPNLIQQLVKTGGDEKSSQVSQQFVQEVKEKGVKEALANLDGRRGEIIKEFQDQQVSARSRSREILRSLLLAAEVAVGTGNNEEAESLYREVLKADPSWDEAGKAFWSFLYTVKGSHVATYGRVDDAENVFREAKDLAMRFAHESPNDFEWQNNLAGSYIRLGLALAVNSEEGKEEERGQVYAEALRILNDLKSKNPREEVLNGLTHLSAMEGDILYRKGGISLPLAAVRYQEYYDAYNELVKRYPENAGYRYGLAIGHMKLGDIHRASLKFDDAIKSHEKSRDIIQELISTHPNVSEPQMNEWKFFLGLQHMDLGSAYTGLKNYSKARQNFTRADEILSKLMAADATNKEWSQNVARNLSESANAVAAEDIVEGLQVVSKSIDIFSAMIQKDPQNLTLQKLFSGAAFVRTDLWHRCNEQGLDALEKKDFALARAKFDTVREMLERLNQNEPERLEWLNGLYFSYMYLGDVDRDHGRLDDAVIQYGRCLKVAQKLVQLSPLDPSRHSSVYSAFWRLAVLAELKGDQATALKHWQSVHTTLQRMLELGISKPSDYDDAIKILEQKLQGA